MGLLPEFELIDRVTLGNNEKILVLALRNNDGSWCAKIGINQMPLAPHIGEQEIALNGYLLNESIGRAFFPKICDTYSLSVKLKTV